MGFHPDARDGSSDCVNNKELPLAVILLLVGWIFCGEKNNFEKLIIWWRKEKLATLVLMETEFHELMDPYPKMEILDTV